MRTPDDDDDDDDDDKRVSYRSQHSSLHEKEE
jgi:hypothetical protein